MIGPGPQPASDKSAASAVRTSGADFAVGTAVQSGNDSNGNPVYTIKAHSLLYPKDAVRQDGVTPDRVIEGVLVTQSKPDGAKCYGFREPDAPEWAWIVTRERIVWGDCQAAQGESDERIARRVLELMQEDGS